MKSLIALAALSKQEKSDVLKFTCLGINGIDCKKDIHMHALTMTFTDKNQVKQEWVMMQEGKEAMTVTFNLRRK